MLLKKSPHAVAAPQAKISTSQIGLQAARESWLGVKRPMKTSRNSSAPTFSTVSAVLRRSAPRMGQPESACSGRIGSALLVNAQSVLHAMHESSKFKLREHAFNTSVF
jgi:hypothetical protein